MNSLLTIQKELRTLASKKRAQATARFFKTRPGEYGEGDVFIGVTMPDIRNVARRHSDTSVTDIKRLFKSKIHEDRMLAGLLLVDQYEREDSQNEKKKICDLYLKLRKGLNNWDLVDVTVYKILGDWTYRVGDAAILYELANSKRHWDRRMAMVATMAWVKKGDSAMVFRMAELFLNDEQDLMHKASGWLLREAAKKDRAGLLLFLDKHGIKMPRTMIRYAIEHFSEAQRKKILMQTKKNR
jgi:3-methyladenine DNA glycosylase AlkD